VTDYQHLHRRYEEQARWTSQIRRRLYGRAGLTGRRGVLEVGCGTGAVCRELPALTEGIVLGLDIDAAALGLASQDSPAIEFLVADGFHIPLADASMDAALCHFLLLWVQDPLSILDEMARVTRSGGSVMALAEPDYGGRVDYPGVLQEMGALQRQALRRRGADPLIGRRLRALFHETGLEGVYVGVLGGEWDDREEQDVFRSEWHTWREDMRDEMSESQIDAYRDGAERAWRSGGHILFVPTFYALGRVP
jgi:SAM-dependent methyltransferase